jgi:predicted  nucleic acid-binding Zn-ribbon protein
VHRGIVACALASAVGAPVPALGALTAERPSTEQKRCAAAERRVTRHREGLEQIDARLERDRKARAACTKLRTCDRLDRGIRSEEARRKRIERQLAQFEDEAKAICSSVRR